MKSPPSQVWLKENNISIYHNLSSNEISLHVFLVHCNLSTIHGSGHHKNNGYEREQRCFYPYVIINILCSVAVSIIDVEQA
jgi:hypothetical protein